MNHRSIDRQSINQSINRPINRTNTSRIESFKSTDQSTISSVQLTAAIDLDCHTRRKNGTTHRWNNTPYHRRISSASSGIYCAGILPLRNPACSVLLEHPTHKINDNELKSLFPVFLLCEQNSHTVCAPFPLRRRVSDMIQRRNKSDFWFNSGTWTCDAVTCWEGLSTWTHCMDGENSSRDERPASPAFGKSTIVAVENKTQNVAMRFLEVVRVRICWLVFSLTMWWMTSIRGGVSLWGSGRSGVFTGLFSVYHLRAVHKISEYFSLLRTSSSWISFYPQIFETYGA